MDDKRKALYDALSGEYNLGSYEEFTEKLNDENKRKALYDAAGQDYNLGTYEEYSTKLGFEPNAIKEDNAAVDGSVPMFDDEPNAPLGEPDAERGFGAGAREGWKGLKAGFQNLWGETANVFTGSSQDSINALNELNEMVRQGKDVAAETEDAWTDAGREIRTGAMEFLPGWMIKGWKDRVLARAEKEKVLDDIREALGEAGGDVDKARSILEQRAQEMSYGDEQITEAAEKFADVKPTEGFGAWVGSNVVQMIPSASALIVGAVTKSPAAAKAIGMIGMGGMTAATAGTSMYEARQAGATDAETWKVGITDGMIEYLTEKLPFDRYTSRIMGKVKGEVAQDLFSALRTNKATRTELEKLLVKANERLGGRLFSKKNLKDYVADMLAEGASEFSAEALQTMTSMMYENPEDYPTINEILTNGWEGAKAGFFMGAVLGGASKTMEHTQNRKRRMDKGSVDVALVDFGDGEKDVAEVVEYDAGSNTAVVLHDGSFEKVSGDAIADGYRFSYEEFENARLRQMEDEAVVSGNVTEGQIQGLEDNIARDIDEIKALAPEMTEREISAVLQSEMAVDPDTPLGEAVAKYQEDVARHGELVAAKREADAAKKEAIRTEIETAVGQRFWVQESGEDDGSGIVPVSETVEEVVYADGTVGYVVGMHEKGYLAMVFTDGTKGFTTREEITEKENSGEILSNTVMGLDDYLAVKMDIDEVTREKARMQEEHALSVEEMIATHPQGSVINVGTEEAKIEVPVIAPPTKDGVIVQMPDGTTPMLTWEDVAHAEKKEITPKTNAQLNQSIVDEYRVAYTPAVPAASQPAQQKEEQVKRTSPANPLPLKADGSVDQTALWNKDPEGWAKWNDEKRQDGGADSLAYVTNAIAIEQAKMAELQTVRSQETDFDRRDALDAEIATAQERIDRLVAIQQGYLAQPAVADAVQNVQPEPEPQTEEERAAAEEQRREPFRKRAKELGEKLGVKINIAESLADVQEEQAREEIIGAEVSESGARFPGWYNRDTGEVTIYLPHVRGVADIDRTIIHEVVAHKGLRGLLGKEGYNVLCDAVWDMMTEAERAKYMAYPGVNGDKRLAADEYIARFAEGLDLEQSRPIWNKIAEAVQKILNSMGIRLEVTKEDLADLIAASYMRLQEQARAAQTENAPVVEEVTEEIVPEATIEQQMPESIEKPADPNGVSQEQLEEINKATGGEIETGKGKGSSLSFSVVALGEGAGIEILKDDGQGNVAFVHPDGRIFNANNPIKPEDLKTLPNTVLGYMMKDAKSLGVVDPAKERMLWNKYTLMLNAILSKGSAENGGYEYLSSQWQWIGDTIYKTVAINSDSQYSFSLDITRVCKKNEAVINAIAEMQARLGYGITPGQIMDIYLTTSEEGYQVPCPVCYVFSRYIRNGKYATIMINGQRKYGSKLVDPKTLTPAQQKKMVQYWLNELDKIKAENKANSKEIAKANSDITTLLDEIDKLSKQLTDPSLNLTEEQKSEMIAKIYELDARYKAALNVVSQASLDSWITQFAIHKAKVNGKEQWVLFEDSYMGFPEEMALDLRQTATVMRKYPAIQRFRNSRGAAAGKEITFVANNDLGDVPLALGSAGSTKDLAKPREMSEEEWKAIKDQEFAELKLGVKNLYQQAVQEKDPAKKKKILEAAKRRFTAASIYAKQQSLRGGQRMWSWSDNIERLAPDVFVNLLQLEMLGGALQSYSKQLEGIKLVASMNGYVNGSLMGKGNGYREVSREDAEEVDGQLFLKDGDFIVAEPGKKPFVLKTPVYQHTDGKLYVLEFDDVVGIDPFGKEVNGKHMKGLFELNAEYDRAGNIIVGMNDLHIRMCMADDRIFFIIPWHSSGANTHILAQMYEYLGVEYDAALSQDYTNVQSEKRYKAPAETEEETDEADIEETTEEEEGKKPESNKISQFLVDFWNDHYENAREFPGYGKVAGKDFACGIEGGVEPSDGNGNLSASQMHYRELRDAIFVGVKVPNGVDKNGKAKTKNIPVEEYSEEWLNEIMNDEFLSQAYSKVRAMMGNKGMTNADTKAIYPYEYWDENSTYDTADINGERYLEYCRRLGYKPKFCGKLDGKPETDFGNFTDDKGYWKVLIDRRMYGLSGRFQDLTPVTAENFTPDLVDPEVTKEEFVVTRVADEAGTQTIVDKAIAREESRPGGIARVDYDMTLSDALDVYAGRKPAPKKSGVIDLVEEAKKAVEKTSNISFSFIGERGAANDKTLEGVARLDNLETARQMESQLNPDWSAKENEAALKIKVATGWERGADGLWRYEILDGNIKDNPALERTEWYLDGEMRYEYVGKLPDLYDNPELYRMYPFLKDTTVEINPYRMGSEDGSYNKAINLIKLVSSYRKWVINHSDRYHEIIKNLDNAIEDMSDEEATAYLDEWETSDEAKELQELMKKEVGHYEVGFTEWEKEGYAREVLLHEIQHAIQGYEGFAKGTSGRDPNYNVYGGEVESRNASRRMRMSPEERRNTLLAATEDVARKDQIFLMDAVAGDAQNNISFRMRTDEQREQLFDKAKENFGLTNNFNAAGYMLPDGSLLDFSEANDGGDPNQRSLDHREIEGIIMDEGKEYDSRWMYLADFMNEGAIRLLPEYAGINLMKAPTKEQRQKLFDFIYKYNGEVILEIADERLNNVAYVEYDRRTSPSRIFRDIDRYFNEGIVPQQSGISFRVTAEQDKDYMDAVEAGDMETAQRMVDEAAKAAGYTIRGDHGRVSKFTIFDKKKANPEGNWGQGFYFTNNEEDVEENYATVDGPDLEAKIEREVEKRMAMLEEDEDYDPDESEVDEFTIREEVEDEFITAEPNVVHAALKMENPFVVGHGMVEVDEHGLAHYDMEETILGVEYETDEDGEADYDSASGTLVDLVEALNEELSNYEGVRINAYDILSNNIDGMTASQFETEARELLENSQDYLLNDDLAIMTSEILRAAIERAGFDGIIDNTVNRKFGEARQFGQSMSGVDANTRHYVVFKPNQIKDTDPVTYDDAGNVIPLSERFNPKKEDIRFRMRTEEEDAMEFAQSAIDDCLSRYNDVAEVKVFPVNEETAERFGYTLEELKKTGGEYVEDEDLIAIFANEDYDDSAIFENIFFHESIHKIASFFTEFVEIGEWLWNNAGEVGLQAVKTHIEENYKPSQYNEEMLTFGMSLAMSIGVAGKQEKAIPQIYRSAYRKILNEIGYEPEKESRRAEERISDSSRKEAHRNERKADEGGRGKEGETRTAELSTAELSTAERRVIGEYFPEFNKSEDVRMRVNSQGEELTEGQKEFFANSKAVDKDGNLLVLYHGTPRAGFTEFKSGWFTTSKEDAISYSGDRKGRLFDPNEKYEPETLTAGDFRLGYMTFDSEEDRAAFLERFPYADEVMSEREYEDARMGAEDEEYDALTARRKEFAEVWNAYREYERERFVDTPIADLIANPEAYTEEDLMRAMLEYDSNASLDSLDDMSAEERKDALVSALQTANEETEGGILDMVIPTRVPRNGEGLKHNDLGNRTYEVYANVENPYEIDANGKGSEFESGDIYKAVEEALADEQYDGVIVRNWRVGRYQQLGDVVVPKDGNQIKLTSNENPTKSHNVSFRTSLELDEEFGDALFKEESTADENGVSFRVVTDSTRIEELEDGPKVEAYRAVQIDKNGKIYSPMASRLKSTKKGTKQATNEAAQMNQWDEAVESLDKVDENGKITILDEDGGTTKVAYNPYGHCCVNSMMNDQFKRAWGRDGLYVMKVLAPESELTAGYHAEKAKDAVGIHKWKTGAVGNKLPENKRREILLTRWMKNVKVMLWEEVAQDWIKTLEGENIDVPFNVVPRKILNMLAEAGVKIVAPEKGMKNATKAYKQWLADPKGYVGNTELPDHVKALNEETDDEGPDNEPRFRTTGTPTDEVVANGLTLTPAQTAEVAANIFAALPEESREKITDGLNGNILGLQDAIMQIPASLATKENWNEEDRAMADVVAEEMTKMAGEMTRPFSAPEALWLLYNNLNKGNDLISQASRALVQRNLGFDEETLERQEEAKQGVSFRMVGDATANAKASMYNRGAVNVWTRLKESFVDMQASVEELVSAIEKATGKEAKGFENILLALNQQSSKGLAAMESYEQRFLMPMFDEVRKIMDKAYAGYDTVVRYVILKHGLERNKKLAQRDAKAHYQEIYDEMIAKVNSMDDRQKRTYLTNAQLQDADAKAKLATLKAADTSAFTEEEKNAHKRELAKAKEEAKKAKENLERAQKINSMSEQELKDELDKVFEKIENGTDSVYKELRKNDYSGISSMFYDQLGVNRKDYSTEEEYQAALMLAKNDRFSSLEDVEAQAEGEVSSFEGRVDTKELWKRINAATKETLRQQYEANMISKDQYESLRNMFEYYVPLRGFKDNTAEDMYTYYRKPNSTGYTKPILGAEGRKTEAESPFGWIAAMAGSAIASNVKNEAKLALYYFVSNRPDNGIATLSRTWFVHTPGDVDANGKKIFKPAYPPFSEDLSSDAAKQAYEDWQEQMRELQKQGLAYEAGQRLNLGNAVVNISDANKPEHVVTVKVAGKDYTIVINGNPRAAQAINGELNLEGTADDYSAIFGPVLRWMSSVNTSYNPEFWITNLMRDMAFTWMAINTKEDPAYRKKFSKNYWKCFRVIGLVAKNEKGTIGNSYMEDMYKDFVKYGGVTGYTQIKDSETWEKEIDNYLRSTSPESLKNGRMMRGMKTFFHAAHRFGESLEQVSRFAAFLTSREMGKTINEAIADAKEITVNFNRKGSGKMISLEESKYLTDKNGQPLSLPARWAAVGLSSIAPLGRRTIMFFNAAVQGLNSVYRLWQKNPKRLAGWTLAYFVIGVMNAALHAMLDDDDDYLDIPQYERRNSLMLGGNGAYLKWALPQEARAFYALGDLAVETVLGRNPHQNIIGESLKIATEVLPVNPAEGWKAFVPSVAIPAVELMLNEDYKGAPIYNEQKWLSDEERKRTAKWSSAYQGTGAMYKGIAQGLNYVTGGDKHDAGKVNLQPEKMEYIVQSAFGGTIRTADKFINTIWAMFDPEEDVTVRQTPFLNRILTLNDERFKNVHVNEVFDYYKADADHALTLEKRYMKDRDLESLNELRKSEEYQWAKVYRRYKKALDNLKEKLKVAEGTAEKKELMRQQDEIKRRVIKEISEL